MRIDPETVTETMHYTHCYELCATSRQLVGMLNLRFHLDVAALVVMDPQPYCTVDIGCESQSTFEYIRGESCVYIVVAQYQPYRAILGRLDKLCYWVFLSPFIQLTYTINNYDQTTHNNKPPITNHIYYV